MKVIDLLNKIANGEEVTKRIKYEKHIYEYEEGTYDWSYYIENNGTIKFLLTDLFNSDNNILSILNEEVEILEEEKKMPEKLDDFDIQGLEVSGYSMTQAEYLLEDGVKENRKMINLILDYLKSKGE